MLEKNIPYVIVKYPKPWWGSERDSYYICPADRYEEAKEIIKKHANRHSYPFPRSELMDPDEVEWLTLLDNVVDDITFCVQ